MIALNKVVYSELKSRQQENFNFHKVASLLADYGFNSMRLNDDWQGADFVAIHINGEDFLKVQLKSRAWIDRKYCNKEIYIAFPSNGQWYLYPHDEVMDKIISAGLAIGTRSWDQGGAYSWPSLRNQKLRDILVEYQI